jgi:hypothetical protein
METMIISRRTSQLALKLATTAVSVSTSCVDFIVSYWHGGMVRMDDRYAWDGQEPRSIPSKFEMKSTSYSTSQKIRFPRLSGSRDELALTPVLM